MLQLEKRFEHPMINFEGDEPPIRHYPIAEALMGQPVWHILGVLPVCEPDGNLYHRRSHFITTKAGLAFGILDQNRWTQAEVWVVLTGLITGTNASEVARCLAFWECCDQNHPEVKGWGCDAGAYAFADPSDGLDPESVRKGKVVWAATPAPS